MRILQVFEPATGGVPVHVEALTSGLAGRGHRVDVLASREASLGPGFEGAGARVIRADLVPEIFAHRANARAFRELLRTMRSGGYDVVHLHGAKAGTLGRPAAALARIPAVYSSHAWVYRTQHRRERRGRNARRALTLGIERALAPLTRAIVCVSQDERQAAVDDRIARNGRLRVVYYGIPLDRSADPAPELAEFREEGPLFGFMARLDQQKGLPLLFDALRILRDRGTLPRFALVGNGPMQEWVEARVAEGGFGDSVRLFDFEPPVEPRLAAFDVFVMPSFWEALPIAVLEAMAAELPVIATTVNGLPEAVEEGRTGLLVAPDAPEALADAVERLAGDAKLRETMGASGRARCEERFALDGMTDRMEQLYRELATR